MTAGLGGARVLVTGADGFIGSHLTERLLAEGAAVRALCLYTSQGTHGWLEELVAASPPGLEAVRGDVRDPRFVAETAAGCDLVCHLAALVAIPHSYEAPQSYVETNVLGTLHVLEAARAGRVRRLVHTSTSEVYGTPEKLPITEAHPLRAQSPYAATKIAADQLSLAFAASYDVPVTVLRPFNTYGPRQSLRAVIPTVLSQLLAGVRPLRLGRLDPRRDFTFVADTVDAFVRALGAELPPGTVVQVGTGRDWSVAELVERAAVVLGVSGSVEVATAEERVRPAASEVEVLRADASRAADLLGWQPRVTLEQGLARTAEWLRGRVVAGEAGRYHR